MAAIADGDYLFDTILANYREAAKGNGVISGMVVIETATPDKTVTVGTGSYIANGTKVTKGTTTSVDLTSHINGSNPNKVIVTADSAGSITATAATAAAANPVGSTGPQTKVPLLPNLPADEILLAEVWLATAETTILNADITNHIITVVDHAAQTWAIQSGMIVIWSGTIATIPTGFVICDGNNSSPNLLTKFLQGVATAATNPGSTGGSATHALVTAELASHGHSILHTASGTDSAAGIAGAAAVNYSTTTNSGVITQTAGSGTAHENEPTFFDVAFVMKT